MPELGDRSSRRDRPLRQAALIGAAGIYGAAQGLSAWAAQRAQGRGTRPQYEQFERPAFAPPGAVFPVAWSALNLTTATSAWRVWRARPPGQPAPSRREVLAWWALAVIIRSGYTPLAFGRRRLWAATADAALLFATMARYAFLARRLDHTAAMLAVPEIAWTASATVLSTAIAAKTANWPKRCRAAVPGKKAPSADSPDLGGTTELGRPTPLRAESAFGSRLVALAQAGDAVCSAAWSM